MPFPTAKTFLGIAKEAVKGTPVASTGFIPVTKLDPLDHVAYIEDKNWRGAMVENYGQVQGPIWSEIDFGGDAFIDTIGWPLAGVLGDVATTGTGTFTHTMAVKNSTDGQPISYTLNDNYSVQNRQYPGCQFSEVSLNFNGDGFLKYDAKAIGLASATAVAPTASFGTLAPVTGWSGQLTVNAVGLNTLTQATLNIKRAVAPINTADNTQAPYKIWAGPLTFDGTFTVVMEDETLLTNYLSNAQQAAFFNFTQGTASLKINASKCAMTVAKINRGSDFVALDMTFSAVANTTDVGASAGFSPVKVTLINSVAASTYA